jgi:hypothetical protein
MRARMTWARLLKRVFDFDIEHCECGGKLKIIAPDRRAGADRAHSHAPGLVGSSATAHAGAVRRTVSGTLTVEFGPLLP